MYFNNLKLSSRLQEKTPKKRKRSVSPTGALLIESFKKTYDQEEGKQDNLQRSISSQQLDKISGLIMVQKAQNSISGILKK